MSASGSINPTQHFIADKMESGYPALINKKIVEIIDSYPKIKSYSMQK